MKILILASSFYPNISPRSYRTTELAKELVKQGHEVKVYFKKEEYDYTGIENKYGIKVGDYGKFYIKNIRNDEGGVFGLIKRVLNRLLLQLFEYPTIELMYKVWTLLKREKEYNLMITIAVPHAIHWGASMYGRNLKKKIGCWIADCGDPYMFCGTDSFKKMSYFSIFEKRFCKYADYITVPIGDAINAYYPEFRKKIRVIPQGFDMSSIDSLRRYKKNERPTFAYAGSFVMYQSDPEKFLQYLVSLDCDYLFYIYTRQVNMIKNYDKLSNGRIVLKPYIQREALMQELSGMDFLVHFEVKTKVQRSSKLIDYAILGKPVLSISSDVLDVNIIEEFLKGDYSGSYSLENIEDYNINSIARKFVGLSEKST